MSNINEDVTVFLDGQDHQLRKEIERLRTIILNVDGNVMENIKWNGPNYTFNNQDRITMKTQPQKQIQLIFHRGAKVKEQPKQHLIREDYGMLVWKENDRAVAVFKNMEEIKRDEKNLAKIITEWITAAK